MAGDDLGQSYGAGRFLPGGLFQNMASPVPAQSGFLTPWDYQPPQVDIPPPSLLAAPPAAAPSGPVSTSPLDTSRRIWEWRRQKDLRGEVGGR